MPRLRYFSIMIVLCLSIYLAIIRPQQKYYYAHHVDIHGTYLIDPIKISDFELTDTRGKPFNKNSLKNHWTFLFFGFTHCSVVCPTTLGVLDKTYRSLAYKLSNKNIPNVIFISIDPEQDNIDSLNKYITDFNPNFIGAVTTPKNIGAIKSIFHVASKAIVTNRSKTFEHSPEILLINPHAEIQAYFSYPQNAEQLAQDYHSIIRRQ